MFGVAGERVLRVRRGLRTALTRVEVLALFPILVLLAHEFAGPQAVIAAAMILPTLLVLLNVGPGSAIDLQGTAPHAAWQEEDGHAVMLTMLDRVAAMPSTHGACFLLQLDTWERVTRNWGSAAAADVLDRLRDRLRGALRDTDRVTYLGAGRFGVVAYGLPSSGTDVRNTMANRLQACLAAPLRLGETSMRVTASLGHAPLSGEALDPAREALAAAELALSMAQNFGPGSVRGHWAGMTPEGMDGHALDGVSADLAAEVPEALQTGAIQPWFLPQVDAGSGAVTGFEIVARWDHPSLGVLTPAHLARSVTEAGQIDAVDACLRTRAIDALSEWDRAGVPGLTISMRVAAQTLRNPALAEQIAWTLDAADIAPKRLILAISEPVADAPGSEAILSTLAAVRQQGVRLALDDFGTGAASLLSIRRFGVARLRLDRSLTVGLDQDTEQRAMVGGILSLAREMRLGTLAQGVDTPQARATLAEMGCDVLQGGAIGAPMSFAATRDWLRKPGTPRPEPLSTLPEHRPSA